jgi:hypothetical protein
MNWYRAAKRCFGRLAHCPVAAGVLIAVLSFALSAGYSQLRFPVPAVHDEFSYLLGADTLVHGRLTNPTHPLWVHFESVHIIQKPTYASKYPPGQALALALGQILTGQPIAGAWISTALACAAIYWGLLAWLPPRWALLGGALAIVHPTLLEWSQCYFGGSVAAIGGALVLGAFRRLWDRPRVSSSLLLAVGLAILANTRPYEGFVLALPCAVFLTVSLLRRTGPAARQSLVRIVCPVAVVLAAAGLWMGYYNFRVTGDPWRLPYRLHEDTYAVAPSFLFLAPSTPPVYRHEALQQAHTGWELYEYTRQLSPAGLLWGTVKKLWLLLFAFAVACPIFLLSLPALGRVPGTSRWMRFAVWTLAFFACGLLLETYATAWSYYVAPAAGLAFVVLVQCARLMRTWKRTPGRVGWSLFRIALMGALIVVPALNVRALLTKKADWAVARARLLDQLNRSAGKHLIIVRYDDDHNEFEEWVYNEAEIDAAKVVWARDRGRARNDDLLHYFSERSAWLLDADAEPPQLHAVLR